MDVTLLTWSVAMLGLLIIGLLGSIQFIAVLLRRSDWTIKQSHGGSPGATDSNAYFAFNQGFAWADSVFWAPFQVAGSIGMLLGERWGFRSDAGTPTREAGSN